MHHLRYTVRSRLARGWAVLPPLFLAIFFFYPLAAIVGYSLRRADSLGALLPGGTGGILWFTLWQAIASTLLTLLLALPAAHVFARYTFPGKRWLETIATLPFVLPTVVVANAFAALLGRTGWINRTLQALFALPEPPLQIAQTVWIILLAHIFYNFSVALRLIGGFWAQLDDATMESAATLGANPWTRWRTVTLPLLRPAIAAAATLVFIFSFTSFGVVLILGGGRFATLEVAIYETAVQLFDLPAAAALSLLQIGFTSLLMWLYGRVGAGLPLGTAVAGAARRPRTAAERRWIGVNAAGVLLLTAGPLAALLLASFAGQDGPTLRYYTSLFENPRGSILFVPPATAVVNSVAAALATVALALPLGVMAARLVSRSNRRYGAPRFTAGGTTRRQENTTNDTHGTSTAHIRIIRAIRGSEVRTTHRHPLRHARTWLDPLFMLPLATSAVTLGFGFIIALDTPPLDLRSRWILLPIAHTLVALPFVLRAVLPALENVGRPQREAAATLGADAGQVWWTIEWPLIRRAVLAAAAFAFTISMGEFGATAFLARPERPTLPVAIFRYLGQPGPLNYGRATALSVILLAVCAIAFLIIGRLQSAEEQHP